MNGKKRTPKPPAELIKAFADIKCDHDKALRKRAARVVLGSSVIRVFKPGTKDTVLPSLANIDVDALRKIKSQEAYRKWFEQELSCLASVIAKDNQGNKRIRPGLKWGHASKVLCLYVREIVLCSRYFKDADARRISKWLYAPIDGIAMRRLESLGVRLPFTKIREVATPKHFYLVQDLLGSAARPARVPRIWFDDIWGSRPTAKA